jgi:hypothetical protein
MKVVVLVLALGLFAARAGAQSVSGRLTDQETGEGIFGASVTLVDGTGERRAATTTDRTGRWSMRAPLSGASYRLRAEGSGYARVETEPFVVGAQPVVLSLSTRREVVVLEGVSAKALAYAGVLDRAQRRRSARTLLPDDIAERMRRTGARNTGALVSSLIGGLDVGWPGWPRFRRLKGRDMPSVDFVACDAVVAVDGIPHFKFRPEVALDRLVPLSRVRAVEVFRDPLFLPSELRLEFRRLKTDPPINCGVVAIWTDEGIALP